VTSARVEICTKLVTVVVCNCFVGDSSTDLTIQDANTSKSYSRYSNNNQQQQY